jgi:hypothetical protein
MMTEQDETEQASGACPPVGQVPTDDTAAAPEPQDPETTIVATDTVAAPELAWSIDDEPTTVIDRHSWSDTGGNAATVLGIALMAAIGVYVVHTINHHHDVQVSAPATTHPTAASAMPSAPVLTTVTVTPTAAPTKTADVAVPTTTAVAPTTPTRGLSDDDFYMLLLTEDGVVSMPRNQGIQLGHDTCSSLGLTGNEKGTENWLMSTYSFSFIQAATVKAAAAQVYCPQYR